MYGSRYKTGELLLKVGIMDGVQSYYMWVAWSEGSFTGVPKRYVK
jgi:hypothetical protein